MAGGLGLEPNSYLKIKGWVHNGGGKTKMNRGTKVPWATHIRNSYFLYSNLNININYLIKILNNILNYIKFFILNN